VNGEAQVLVTPVLPLAADLAFVTRPISFFHPIWPVAGLAAAILANVAWMGFLGYGFFKLVESSFF
jgi:hypothetical protein